MSDESVELVSILLFKLEMTGRISGFAEAQAAVPDHRSPEGVGGNAASPEASHL